MNDPDRLLQTERSVFTRRLLEEAQQERPSSELSAKMLLGLSVGLSATALSSAAEAAGNSVPPPAPLLSAGTTSSAIGSKLIVGVVTGLAGAGLLVFMSLPEAKVNQGAAQLSANSSSPRSPESTTVDAAEDTRTMTTSSATVPSESASREDPKAPVLVRPSVKTDRLDQELALLDSARQRLSQGESKEALRLLQQYSSRFPQGKLKQEATILRVNALEAQGKDTEATRLSQEFLRDNPDSAHKRRLGPELEK